MGVAVWPGSGRVAWLVGPLVGKTIGEGEMAWASGDLARRVGPKLQPVKRSRMKTKSKLRRIGNDSSLKGIIGKELKMMLDIVGIAGVSRSLSF